MQPKVVYVSAPYTGREEAAYQECKNMVELLLLLGVTPISPIHLLHEKFKNDEVTLLGMRLMSDSIMETLDSYILLGPETSTPRDLFMANEDLRDELASVDEHVLDCYYGVDNFMTGTTFDSFDILEELLPDEEEQEHKDNLSKVFG